MQCPKCGKENPDDAQICSFCSCDLSTLSTTEPTPKHKISKMAIGSAVLAGLAAALTYFVNPTLAFFAALSGAFTAVASISKIKKSKRKLIGKRLAVGAVIFSTIQVVLLSYWRIDAAPISNDYTIADLRSAPPECAPSYELLMSISEKEEHPTGAPAIGLSAQDVNTIEQVNEVIKKGDYSKITETLKANADRIIQAWENAKKGRDVIKELNIFPEIADLTEPNMNAKFGFLRNLRHLARLYQAYVNLQSVQGNEEILVEELLKLDNSFRKLNSNARSLVTKLVCIACFRVNIETANFIINHPQTSQKSLELLAEHFVPLTNEQISLRNSFISEYLMFKNELSKIFRQNELKYSAFSPLKFNSSMRVYRNFCDSRIAAEENRQEIEEFSVWPAIYPKLPVTIDIDGHFPWYYKVYNPVGCAVLRILTPALDRVSKIKTKLQIENDLLQIVLNKRLGNEVSLKARAYSDEYIIDVDKKMIFSPGPDGKADTKDDIKLMINPEVLNLTD